MSISYVPLPCKTSSFLVFHAFLFLFLSVVLVILASLSDKFFPISVASSLQNIILTQIQNLQQQSPHGTPTGSLPGHPRSREDLAADSRSEPPDPPSSRPARVPPPPLPGVRGNRPPPPPPPPPMRLGPGGNPEMILGGPPIPPRLPPPHLPPPPHLHHQPPTHMNLHHNGHLQQLHIQVPPPTAPPTSVGVSPPTNPLLRRQTVNATGDVANQPLNSNAQAALVILLAAQLQQQQENNSNNTALATISSLASSGLLTPTVHQQLLGALHQNQPNNINANLNNGNDINSDLLQNANNGENNTSLLSNPQILALLQSLVQQGDPRIGRDGANSLAGNPEPPQAIGKERNGFYKNVQANNKIKVGFI